MLDPILPATRVAAMRDAGYWRDRVITDCLDRWAAGRPDAVAVVTYNSERDSREVLTYGELKARSDEAAVALVQMGVDVGDVVAFQLPNWWEFIALHLACVRIGAVSNPLMPIFRQRELAFMLRFCDAKVLVVPRRFRGFDYPAMVADLRAGLPALEHLLVVDGGGETDASRLFCPVEPAQIEDLSAQRPADPNRVIQLMYTSGTTGEPKGVMHTSNTLLCGVDAYVEALGITPDDVCYMASPLAHQTGFMYGMVMPLMLGTRLVMQDIWNADAAWPVLAREGVTFTMASTPFLADLNGSPLAREHHDGTFRMFMCGGAPIPQILLESVTENLGIAAIAGWGMTEIGVVTAARPGDPMDKIVGTDGRPFTGTEVRVVDAAGVPQPPGVEGALQARGMTQCVGYLKKPELYGTDAEGWFDTGDLARMDEDGYIRICGRSKDIIIRGGENVPVAEVEEELYRHPAVVDAAVVAMPDARLGERGCAFVTVKPGAQFDLAALRAHLEAAGMARHFWPERVEVVAQMPRTASGKIQTFVLRDKAQRLAAQ
ncbi:MAG: AMP-binding protein [Pseudomonadota bacterium]|nr:AMP-binding protein [Pseudomonadota bacterium]